MMINSHKLLLLPFDSCFQFSVFLFYFPAFTNSAGMCLFLLAAFHSFSLILLCFDSKAASAIFFLNQKIFDFKKNYRNLWFKKV